MWKRNIYFQYTGVSHGDQGQEHSWASEGSGSHTDLPLSVSPLCTSLHVCFIADQLYLPCTPPLPHPPPPRSDWKVAIS